MTNNISLDDFSDVTNAETILVNKNMNEPNNAFALPVVLGNNVILLAKLFGKIIPPI